VLLLKIGWSMPEALKTRVLSCRVTDETAKAFALWANTQRGLKPAKALALAIEQLSKPFGGRAHVGRAVAPAGLGPGARHGLYVRVNEQTYQGVLAVSKEFGGVSAWLRGVVESALGRSSDLPNRSEVMALNQATIQMWHAATNVNQIARHMNEARKAGEPVPVGSLSPEALFELSSSFEALAEANTAVIAAARKRSLHRG
jgi:hypothetical protein